MNEKPKKTNHKALIQFRPRTHAVATRFAKLHHKPFATWVAWLVEEALKAADVNPDAPNDEVDAALKRVEDGLKIDPAR